MTSTPVMDILGPEGAAGSPAAVRDVATRLADVSGTCTSIQSGLAGLDSGRWTGAAATAFREKAEADLPHELTRIAGSFGQAADTLSVYAGQLEWIIDEARRLGLARDAAIQDVASARQAEQHARADLRSARSAAFSAVDPASFASAAAAVRQAEGRFRTAVGARADAEAALRTIEGQAEELRETLECDARACATGLEQASAAGIRNTIFSAVDRHVLDDIVRPVVSEVADTVGKFGAATAHLAGAVADAAAHGFDPERLDKVAEAYTAWVDAAKPIVMAIAITVAIAAVIVAFFVAPPAAAGLLALASSVSTGSAALSVGLNATKTQADLWLVMRGKRSSDVLLHDSIDLAFDAVAFKLGPGYSGHVGALKSSLAKQAQTGTHQAAGWVTRRMQDLRVDTIRDLGEQVIGPKVEDAVHQGIDHLLGPPPPDPGPIHQPSGSLCQGPDARLRARVPAVPIIVPGAVAR